mgnify:CR=1 FL=1
MPKRKNSDIKDYTLKNGEKRYKFQTYLGLDDNGKRVMVTRQGFRTYTEANEEYEKLRAKGTQGYTKPKQTTVEEVWKLWFDNYKRHAKEATAHKMEQMYKYHVKPDFGNNYVDKIKPPKIQKWINHLSTTLVQYRSAFNLLNNLIKYSIVMGFASYNPMTRVLVPKKTTKKRRDTKNNYYSSTEEVTKFLDAAKNDSEMAYVFFKLLVSTGIRKGEALALKWSDIDFKNNIIHITKTVDVGFHNKELIRSPKTKESTRDVPLSKNLKVDLLKYRSNLYEYIFCKANGDHLSLSTPASWLARIYKNNTELKQITVHGFRHTFATLTLQPGMGNTPKDIQKILGHSTVDMTLNIYTHESKKGQQNVIRSIDALNF